MSFSPFMAGSAVEDELKLITFDVSKDQFALDIMGIGQILKYEGSTEVPKAPDFVEGIIILRDQVIPIVDLRRRLFPDVPSDENGDRRVLVLRFSGVTIGLKVDRVRKIVSLRQADVLPAPPLVQGTDARFFKGVVRVDGSVVLLLDVEKILTVSEKEALGQAVRLAGGAA